MWGGGGYLNSVKLVSGWGSISIWSWGVGGCGACVISSVATGHWLVQTVFV